MKPHPRIRKTIKWGGAAVTVLLVVVWFWSLWGYVICNPWSGLRVSVAGGELGILSSDGPLAGTDKDKALLRAGMANVYWRLGFTRWHSTENKFRVDFVGIPVCLLSLPALVPTLIAWSLDMLARHRERAHLCPKCGYDRTGILKDAKCPECGSVPA